MGRKGDRRYNGSPYALCLEVRLLQEEAKKAELSVAARSREALQQRLKKVRASRLAASPFAEASRGGVIQGLDLAAWQDREDALRAIEDKIKVKLAAAMDIEKQKKRALAEAAKSRKAVEKLEQRWQENYRKEQNRKDRRAADRAYLASIGRKGHKSTKS